jgi:hypothetical protein
MPLSEVQRCTALKYARWLSRTAEIKVVVVQPMKGPLLKPYRKDERR